MTRLLSLFLVVLYASASFAQEKRSPVYVSHSGKDRVGSLFEAALKEELFRSPGYVLRKFEEGSKTKFRFHIELASVDLAVENSDQGKRSAASVVIEQFGLPNSYPVAELWYHKIFVIDEKSVGNIAKDLVDDMSARWCNYIKSSVGSCPKEKLFPQY